jgi:hypothetical protein
MPNLPVKRMVLYKHGVGFFERYGSLGAESSITLTFKKEEMNDVLKSLAAFPQGDGQVMSVSYETPEDKQDALGKAPLVLGDREAWLDLVRSLRGSQVRLHIAGGDSEAGQQVISAAGSGSEFVVSGCLVGLNQIDQKPEQTLVTLMTAGIEADSTPNLRTYLLTQVCGLDILDAQSSDDLRYILDLSHSREDQRSVTNFSRSAPSRPAGELRRPQPHLARQLPPSLHARHRPRRQHGSCRCRTTADPGLGHCGQSA